MQQKNIFAIVSLATALLLSGFAQDQSARLPEPNYDALNTQIEIARSLRLLDLSKEQIAKIQKIAEPAALASAKGIAEDINPATDTTQAAAPTGIASFSGVDSNYMFGTVQKVNLKSTTIDNATVLANNFAMLGKNGARTNLRPTLITARAHQANLTAEFQALAQCLIPFVQESRCVAGIQNPLPAVVQRFIRRQTRDDLPMWIGVKAATLGVHFKNAKRRACAQAAITMFASLKFLLLGSQLGILADHLALEIGQFVVGASYFLIKVVIGKIDRSTE